MQRVSPHCASTIPSRGPSKMCLKSCTQSDKDFLFLQPKAPGGRRARYAEPSDEDEDDEEEDDRPEPASRCPRSPASPLPSPRGRGGGHPGAGRRGSLPTDGDGLRARRGAAPPRTSPRLLNSRSPNNLSPRTPSPVHRKAPNEYVAYYEEDLDLKPKSTSPRNNKPGGMPSLGADKLSPRDKARGDNFNRSDHVSPRSRFRDEDADYREEGRRRDRERDRRPSAESPPLSPLSSSGGSARARSPDSLRTSWGSERDYLSSSGGGTTSPRDDKRPSYVPPLPVRKKNLPARLEPIDYR